MRTVVMMTLMMMRVCWWCDISCCYLRLRFLALQFTQGSPEELMT